MSALLLAVDVGTEEARAAAIDEGGRLIAIGAAPLALMRTGVGHAVYRMDAVWHAACEAVRACVAGEAGLGARVVGLGFAASASLVLVADGGAPLEGAADVLAWCDRRAEAEAAEATLAAGRLVGHSGGTVTAERHAVRLMWLRRRAPEAFARLRAARDLCDELTRRATGDDRHGLAALSLGWPYAPEEEDPWRHDFLDALDLGEIWTLGALAGDPVPAGVAQGALEAAVAAHLGLPPGIPVAAGLPGACAGLLGGLGRNLGSRVGAALVLVAGQASALVGLAAEGHEVPGIAGPFRDTVFPGLWLSEAGQGWSGAALDEVLARHPGGPGVADRAAHRAAAAEVLALLEQEGAGFAAGRHVVPDWRGNLAPLGDGAVRALVTGIGEEESRRACLEAYYATARGLALQVRHIVGHLAANGFGAGRVSLVGGQAANPLLERLYRDAIGVDLVVCRHAEPVLLGVAMGAAAAAGVWPGLAAALDGMAPAQARLGADPFWKRAHDAAYGIYLRLVTARDDAARAAEGLARLGRPG